MLHTKIIHYTFKNADSVDLFCTKFTYYSWFSYFRHCY